MSGVQHYRDRLKENNAALFWNRIEWGLFTVLAAALVAEGGTFAATEHPIEYFALGTELPIAGVLTLALVVALASDIRKNARLGKRLEADNAVLEPYVRQNEP